MEYSKEEVEYIESLLATIDDLKANDKRLRRANSNLKAEVRYYRRSLGKLQKEMNQQKKPKCNKGRRFR